MMDSFNDLCLKWWEGFSSSFQHSCTMTCISEDGALDVKPGEISILLGVGGSEASSFLNSCGVPVDVIQFNRVLCQIETLCLPKIILMYEQYKSSLHLENKSEGMVIDAFQLADQSDVSCQMNPSASQAKSGSDSRIEHLEIISADCLKPETVETPVSSNASGLSSMTILIQSPEDKQTPVKRISSSSLEGPSISEDNVRMLSKKQEGSNSNVKKEKEMCGEIILLELACDKSKGKLPELEGPFSEKDTDTVRASLSLDKEESDRQTTSAQAKESISNTLEVEMQKINQIKIETSESNPQGQKMTSGSSGQIRRSSRQIRVSAKFSDDREVIRRLIKPEIPDVPEALVDKELPCVCSTCRAVFSSPAKLRSHWKSHKENRAKRKCTPFFCLKCHSSFSSHQNVKVHHCSREFPNPILMHETNGRQNMELNSKTTVSPDLHGEKQKNVLALGDDEEKINEIDVNIKKTLVDGELYSCDVCSLSFQSNQLLRTHFLTHGRKPYKCSECGHQFHQKKALSRHSSTKHSSTGLLPCEKSSKSFLKPQALEKQMEVSLGKKSFFCEVCGKGFHRQQLWLNHQKLHELTNKFQCQQCEKSFIDKRSLESHHSVHTGEKPHVCEICGKRFRIVRGLINHSRIHDKSAHYKCERCPKTFIEKRSLEAHKLAHSGVKPFICNVCGKTFRRELGLLNHSRLHDLSKAIKCDVCNKSFVDKWGMLKHKSIHTGEKPFTCDVCGKSFRIKKGLHDHVKLHNKDLQYKCDLCPRTFVEKRKLDIHLRAHRGEKAYVCDQCGQRFMNSMTLKVHKRRHTGEKPYKCNFCDKAFNQQGTLIAHERYHKGEKPYVCEVCGEGYVTKSHLTIHRRKHFNDRPYKCEQCEYAAFTFSLLRIHMLKHSSEKPYKCHVCPAAFKRPHHLDVHMRTHLTVEKLIQCQYCNEAFDSNKKFSAHLASHEIVVVTPHPASDEIFSAQGPGEVAYDIVLLS